MKLNLKLRLKNKATLITLLVTIVAFIYQILEILGITPKIDQKSIDTLITIVVGALAALGIVIDPTTSGIGDSDRAMTYSHPGDDNLDKTVCDDPISDENETVKNDIAEDDGKYIASDEDAVKDVKNNG